MVHSQREIVLVFMEQYPELAQKASELQHGLTLAGWTGGTKKYTKPATMPSPKLKGERPNSMGNSSFDIGICVSRCTGGGRAPGFRGRILRVTGTSRVGGLQVATLYQEKPQEANIGMHTSIKAKSAYGKNVLFRNYDIHQSRRKGATEHVFGMRMLEITTTKAPITPHFDQVVLRNLLPEDGIGNDCDQIFEET
ncbi:hypothetical protein HPB50_010062 [Hyalomma asiaticum]|uniref:Uncharacterized protein n=1 Tax=Hyalomma asiaticum TaxID=266040 RepID=A0ACB7TE61_HYAAI|nr:hypothetical protein HPB50_010062 [Hyalomma asiaticum]